MRYVGQHATVILKEAGEVISTWARKRAGGRLQP